jgi:hypothetical protein
MLKSKLAVLDKFSNTEKLSNTCSTKNNYSPSCRILTLELYFRWRDQSMILLVLSIILLDLSLLVRQDGSVYKINAAKEYHKRDIIALCFNHLKLWIKRKGKFDQL